MSMAELVAVDGLIMGGLTEIKFLLIRYDVKVSLALIIITHVDIQP
jgi:hypothetical protein